MQTLRAVLLSTFALEETSLTGVTAKASTVVKPALRIFESVEGLTHLILPKSSATHIPPKKSFTPLKAAVGYLAPTTPTNRKPLTLKEYKNLNVSVSALAIPRVPATLNPRHTP